MRNKLLSVLVLSSLFGVRAASPGWPQWRGPARDGHAEAGAPIPASLAGEPKNLWRIPIGGGFSSPIVSGDFLVYLDEKNQKETAHCLEARTGREIWAQAYADAYQDEWGLGPRSTPAIDGDRLYLNSCNGELRCLEMKGGKTVWSASYEKDFGVKFLGSKANEGTASRRGNNGAGVIDGGSLVVPVGSVNGATLVCFDKLTGKVLWKAGNDEAAYSSLMVADLAGARQVVAFTADALMGVELKTGAVLWRVPLKTNAKRHAATPVIVGNQILVNSHTFGLLCLEISKEGDTFKASEAWKNTALKINLATPVVVGQFLYTHGPQRNFACVDLKTGRQTWIQDGFGKEYSAVVVLGENLLVLADDGQLVAIKANPAKYEEISRRQICGKNWNHPAYADGKLYIRDNRELACYDLMTRQQASLGR